MKANKKKRQVLSANEFPVIGVGASAGGLNAFKQFVQAIGKDSGMAYVLVQHLAPNHESLLPEILQKVSAIPVIEISDEIKVFPDHIYILPSNKMLEVNDGVLQLSQRHESKAGQNLPIDVFFSSLAAVHQANAIGIVLSGTASDGTLGLKSIKEHGGITFAQELATAQYNSMPQNAINAGVVDFILPPGEMPQKLVDIKQQVARSDEDLLNIPKQDEDIFKQILGLLRAKKDTDFTYYKQTTIRRRILRRMALNKAESLVQYLALLGKNTSELDALYQDMLIPVTEFFRDEKVFDNLCGSVFPNILNNKSTTEPLRIWVAACSTGQEAYSIAMCIKEFLGNNPERVQIFATDISEPAIIKARTGLYTKSEITGISKHRLQEFFSPVEGGYQLKKQIRSMCIFATHNFLKDPPFGKMDFISCRNVLIYMEPYLQKKALTTFHYALNPKSYLLLGKSETSASVPELFAAVEKHEKLFIRKDAPGKYMLVASQRNEQKLENSNKVLSEAASNDFQKTADDIMLSRYTPAGVVVNEAMDIVYFRGNTSRYLEQVAGKPTHNLLKLAKAGLAFELRNLLHKAKKANNNIIKENIQLRSPGISQIVSIEAIALPNMADPHFLILFHPVILPVNVILPDVMDNKNSGRSKKDAKDIRIQQLEKELMQTHEDMRSITEEQEAINEKIQSANEELLSGSEELQSLNEELETSKEELQSTNEELTIANQELVNLNEQLTITREYAEAIIATLPDPFLVLDRNLRIIKANDFFYETFNVIRKDTESLLVYEIGNRQWDVPTLRIVLEKILPEKKAFKDFEVAANFPGIGKRIMLLSGREIIRSAGDDKLILLVIKDITEQKQLELKERDLQHKYAAELEEKVKQRTTELSKSNDQLQQKYEEVKSMNKELESFNYISSHDLQEPLRKIQSFAQRVLQKEFDGLSESGKEYFNIINNSAKRMRALIDDLLTYSRIPVAERLFQKADIAKMIEEAKNDFSDIIAEKKAVVKTEAAVEVSVNPFQFRQIINNLLGNALKFSKPGTAPEITITANVLEAAAFLIEKPTLQGHLDPGARYCSISFRDNGIGFDKKYKDQIFEIFQRLHGKEEFPGTGIGLAVVKKIVENHNGFITATGAVNEGACFEIYIPENNE